MGGGRQGVSETSGWAGWVTGAVNLRVGTPEPHGFLNMLLGAGIPFRSAYLADDGLHLQVPVSGFRRLRPLVHGSGVRVHITGRGGLPFVLARILRRRPLLLTAVLMAAAIYVLSGFVWFVEVQGADRVPVQEVLDVARRLGLAPGVRRSVLTTGALGRELPLLLPEVSWAGVNLYGTLAVIDVVERVRPAPAFEQAAAPGDVVATEGGVVAAVTVLNGQALVHPGERVRQGQILIAGVATMPVARTRQSGPEGMREVRVHASGVVLVRRWYAAYAQVARRVEVTTPTGRASTRLALVVGSRTLSLMGWWRVPFAHYVLERRVIGPLRWRGRPLPVEAVILRYAEVRRFLRRLSLDDARDMAAAEARALLLPRLPPRARIVEERQRAAIRGGDRVAVELLVQAEENIGVFRAASGSESPAQGGQGAAVVP